jgi:hypothetical protein
VLQQYDRALLVSDPRRCEPKKCALLNTDHVYNDAIATDGLSHSVRRSAGGTHAVRNLQDSTCQTSLSRGT